MRRPNVLAPVDTDEPGWRHLKPFDHDAEMEAEEEEGSLEQRTLEQRAQSSSNKGPHHFQLLNFLLRKSKIDAI